MKRRSRRLRKKLHVGEFSEFGFDLRLAFVAGLSDTEGEAFWHAFIVDLVEARGLSFGGGGSGRGMQGFVARAGRGSATEDDRRALAEWLDARPDVDTVHVGPLVDAWR